MVILHKKTYTPEFKAKVVLEVLREERMLNQIASDYEVAPSVVSKWRAVVMADFHQLFAQRTEADKLKAMYEAKVDELHRQIGELQVELSWLKKKYAR